MPALTVTYAGLPFARWLPPEVQERFDRFLSIDGLTDVPQPFPDWPGPNLQMLGMPIPPKPPPSRQSIPLWIESEYSPPPDAPKKANAPPSATP